ncbi:unnamed protein product [Cuscuta campestris]|uniref:Uncharacterized protein n=1 Tax=Cuscuta campestris TaxID=132261 RepID=A0A484N3C9_9ASTE|nr:unnamed protein product [Cuscuta campestris]
MVEPFPNRGVSGFGWGIESLGISFVDEICPKGVLVSVTPPHFQPIGVLKGIQIINAQPSFLFRVADVLPCCPVVFMVVSFGTPEEIGHFPVEAWVAIDKDRVIGVFKVVKNQGIKSVTESKLFKNHDQKFPRDSVKGFGDVQLNGNISSS